MSALRRLLATGAWLLVGAGIVVAAGRPAATPATPRPAEDMSLALAKLHARAQEATYLGGRSGCRRCHLAEYRSWERTPHANAYETLPADKRSDPACVKCHVTGYGDATGFQSLEATPELANVTCEVCHGPGSLYSPREVMEDREASLAAGLRLPNEQTCRGCHNAESPDFPGTFDYQAMLEAGVHEIRR